MTNGLSIRTKIDALTGLRFFAAFSIVLHHIQGEMWIPRYASINQGVSFFFVLSGFILQHNYRNRLSALGPARFIGLRVARIWPTHIAVICLICVYQWPLIFNYFTTHYSNFDIVSVAILLQDWHFDYYHAFALNAPSWSISAELFFYAMFPILSVFAVSRPLTTSLLVSACSLAWLTAMTIYHWIDPSANIGAAVAIHPILRLFEFSLGVSGYEFLAMRRRSHNIGRTYYTFVEMAAIAAIPLAVFFAGLAAFNVCAALHLPLFQEGLQNGLQAFAFVLLIAVFFRQAGAFSAALSTRLFVYLGEISFALYLIHQPVIYLLKPPLAPWFWSMPIPGQVAFYFAIVFTLSIALHHVVELRGIALAKRLISRLPKPDTLALNGAALARDQQQ